MWMKSDTVATRQAERSPTGVRDILDVLLTVEHLTIAFYYTGLTSHGVMRDWTLAGPSANPNHPTLPPHGNPSHVRYLQAALDAEVKHAAALMQGGATSSYTGFYFPERTFRSLGTSTDHGSFLGIMETLESVCEGVYLAAVRELLALNHTDLALVAAQVMGVEAEHHTLGHILSRIAPANTTGLINQPFARVAECLPTLSSFFTGKHYLFARDSVRKVSLPSTAHTRRVIGRYGTRQVRRYLWT